MSKSGSPSLLRPECLRLNVHARSRNEAIGEAAQLLVAAGCIDPAYAASMLRRETVSNTYLGQGVAIPHGMVEDRQLVLRTGIAVLQIRDGVEWTDDQRAQLVVAIAAQSDAHLDILRRLTRLIQNEAHLQQLLTTDDPQLLISALSGETPAAAPAAPTGPVEDLGPRFNWVVAYPSGLHARPATRWVDAARGFGGRLQVRRGSERADAKNLVALLELGLRAGDEVVVSAAGRDAEAALQRFRAVIDALVAREAEDAERAQRRASAPSRDWQAPDTQASAAGIGASPGLAIGVIHCIGEAAREIPDEPIDLLRGGEQLHSALIAARLQLKAIADDAERRLGTVDAEIFAAHAELIADTDLITLACQRMVQGHGVAWSWWQAVQQTAARLAALGNPVLAGRAADLRDVGGRVLALIDPALQRESAQQAPENAVLVATDLAPSDTASLDPTRVAGLLTAHGGPSSHTAILARTLGLPAVVAAGDSVLEWVNGTPVILDGQNGRVYLKPSEADLLSARAFIAQQQQQREREAAERSAPALTRDQMQIEIAANINLPAQVALALEQGAEGVGLMRTEFLFLERGQTPDENEQLDIYLAMARALGGRPLIVRALDIGGDKQVAHLELPVEANPFLGVRGTRLLLRRPDLLLPQLRALYRAAAQGAALSIMFPMITTVNELRELRRLCEQLRSELQAPEVPLGIMIEVPAAAIQADALAAHADFFSIGTNDLTQYVLAMDRQNPELAAEADSLHPAVLRMIQATVQGARRHQRWVGVCGGLAGDPFGACLLSGLGVQELSMTPRDIPAVKARIRASRFSDLQALAERALACASADEVRALDGGLA